MEVLNMCGWCHRLSPKRFCPDCGHEVGVPRYECSCVRCSATRTANEFKHHLDNLSEKD